MSRIPLTSDEVLALSPDDASTKAARGLVAPGKWPMLGANEAAVWGECQGSGSKPYQTQVDVSGSGPTFRCSCPSRKFPCKHGLALLFLQAQSPNLFTADQPAWVSEWLTSRQERAEKKEAKAKVAPSTANPQASAKREEQRLQRLISGAQELALWLDDISLRGLANLSEGDASNWGTMAARMVDAQAPGLGYCITQAFSIVGQGRDWPSRLLERLGQLQLLVDAIVRMEELAPGLQADLRLTAGWSIDRDEVLTQGERIHDQWMVLGQVLIEREDRLTERRVWLQGLRSQHRALLMDFSFAGKPFEQGWVTGRQCSGTLAFYPGSSPLRALWVEFDAQDESVGLAPCAPFDDEWLQMARRMAAYPWSPSWPLWLRSVQLQYTPEAQYPWWFWTDGRSIPLALHEADAWPLLSLAAGLEMSVFGEWTGEVFRPLTAWTTTGLWSAMRVSGSSA